MIFPIFLHAIVIPVSLPIPLGLYLVSCATVVAMSYLISIGSTRAGFCLSEHQILCLRFGPKLSRLVGLIADGIGLVATAILFIVIWAAFFGVDDPLDNITPTFIWVVSWVGISLVSISVGNVWAVLNPWRLLHIIISRIIRRGPLLGSRSRWTQRLVALDLWPACLLFMCFVWVELIYPNSISPRHLGFLLVLYSIITISGMQIFGCALWLGRVEIFSVVFKILSQFAPLSILVRPRYFGVASPLLISKAGNHTDELRQNPESIQKTKFILRPVWNQLLRKRKLTSSESVLIVLMLATMTTDGFLSTPTWATTRIWVGHNVIPAVILDSIPLILGATIFVVAYWLVICAMKALAQSSLSLSQIGGLFAYSLVPIIAGYFIAHYLHLLLIQGQLAIPLLSDPFGFDWNIFGTGHFKVNISLLGAEVYWTIAVLSIVIGHVLSIVISHSVAVREFGSQGAATRASAPMTVLMIGYTVGSLWILAQPIVG